MSDPFAGLPRGRRNFRSYEIWRGMMKRCYWPSHVGYRNYGGRGIGVCARWHDYANFLADMGEPPEDKILDRFPDKDGPYEPANCRWVTWTQQQRNKRNNLLLTDNGETLCLADARENSRRSYDVALEAIRQKAGK